MKRHISPFSPFSAINTHSQARLDQWERMACSHCRNVAVANQNRARNDYESISVATCLRIQLNQRFGNSKQQRQWRVPSEGHFFRHSMPPLSKFPVSETSSKSRRKQRCERFDIDQPRPQGSRWFSNQSNASLIHLPADDACVGELDRIGFKPHRESSRSSKEWSYNALSQTEMDARIQGINVIIVFLRSKAVREP